MTRVCTRCGERQPIENYYFVSKKLGTRRGQCKECMSELKRAQKDPTWRPSCAKCGRTRDRLGSGRRLCGPCFSETYDAEARRDNGSHRLRLKPCRACGAERLREDHEPGTSLCAVCRSVPQGRRKRLRALFNMTPRQYVELLEAQRYRCAVCGRKPSGPFHVDHRHAAPSIVRGLTCGTCNSLIGLARDNVGVLQGAVAYLSHPPAQRVFPGLVAAPEANRRGFTPLRRGVAA